MKARISVTLYHAIRAAGGGSFARGIRHSHIMGPTSLCSHIHIAPLNVTVDLPAHLHNELKEAGYGSILLSQSLLCPSKNYDIVALKNRTIRNETLSIPVTDKEPVSELLALLDFIDKTFPGQTLYEKLQAVMIGDVK